MSKVQVFDLDKNNKRVKRAGRCWKNIVTYPLITSIVLLSIYAIIYVLSTITNFKDNSIISWIGNNGMTLLYVYIVIMTIELVYFVTLIILDLKIKNSVVIKDDKEIMILYQINEINQLPSSAIVLGGLAIDKNSIVNTSISKALKVDNSIVSLLGLGSYLMGGYTAKVKDKEPVKPLIKEVVDNPRSIYKFYTDCKLLEETNSYYLFNGNNIDYAGKVKNTNFKIYKIYKDIEKMIKN